MSAPRGATVVLASAGSGKTFSLTTHYLAAIAAGVAPERILATTFTRKAAGEILDRIFARLVRAARDEHARRELAEALGGGVPTRAAAMDLAVSLARRVERCRVMTIDAFFVVAARALAAELGLAPDWSIADEFREAGTRETAIGRALERGSSARWILLMRELEKARAKRAVHATIDQRVREAHEVFLEANAAAWSALRPPARPTADDLAGLARELDALAPPLTKQGKPVKHWVTGLARLRAALAERDFEGLISVTLAQKVLAGEAQYASVEIAPGVRACVGRALAAAAGELGALYERQNRATHELVRDFDAEFGGLLDERGLVRFADLPRVLGRGDGGGAERFSELAWRLDADIDHLLLDEFQDTSPAQWRVLGALAEELASDGTGERSFFCVGDTKQSIYGWRGGDPRLLESVAHWPTVAPRSLTRSFRSAPTVLAFVDRVFRDLASSPACVERPERLAAAQRFRFEPHTAAKPSLSGAVRIVRARAAGAADAAGAAGARRACRLTAIEVLRELARRAPRAEVGVLVRRKAQVGPLVFALRQAGLAASGESGNPLTDARSVQLALSALHLAEHPADTAAVFHVAHSPLAKRLALRPDDDAPTVAARARALRRELVERGFAATLESFRGVFAAESDWERRRFDRLIEVSIAWESEPRLSTDEFVARVRDLRVEDPSSAAIKVMTIHAAKGLEFDAVVLCDLAYEYGKVPPALIWRREREDPMCAVEAVSRSIPADVRAALVFAGAPLAAELHAATATRALQDEFCALYVALTRARRELVLVLPPLGAQVRFSSAAIVEAALGEPQLDDGAERLCEGGTLAWTDEPNFHAAGAAASRSTEPRVTFAGAGSASSRASPSRAAAARITTTRMVFGRGGPARLRGSRLHAWFETVGWLEDFRATDAELLELARARDQIGRASCRERVS
jgi:ATP-dependent exoDNAse (exonuclease V) beta subunit